MILTVVKHAGALLVCFACLAFLGCEKEPAPAEPTPEESDELVATEASKVDPAVLVRGLALYSKKCATCHGEKGLGDGAAAYLLYPRPRDFSSGRFRLGSTAEGLPSDDDLRDTLNRGMPGSAMPPWSHLPAADIDALVVAVRYFAIEGRVAKLILAKMDKVEARETAVDLLAAGASIVVPPEMPSSPEALAKGRDLYVESCASCHDEDGRGVKATQMKDEQGHRVMARDFTQGVFKGSSKPKDIAMRILRGLHGSPMPAYEMPAEKLWPLVHYVHAMVPEGVSERVLLNQRSLTAAKITGPLGVSVDAEVWGKAPKTFLPVTPLWWRHDRIEGIEFQALHDGTRLAVRLVWEDSTKNDTVLTQGGFGDGAALGFSAENDPPLFAMGARGEPMSIWHWKAAWSRDANGGPPALNVAFANLPTDAESTSPGHPGQDEFATGRVAGNPLSQVSHAKPVEVGNAAGFGSLTTCGPSAQEVDGSAHWNDGRWTVTFVRNLKATTGSDIELAVGKSLSISFAAWNGAAGDRNGQKCISIWHRLTLAP